MNKLEAIQEKFSAYQLQQISKSDFLTMLHEAVIKDCKETPIEVIIKAAGGTIHEESHTILDRAGHIVSLQQMLERNVMDSIPLEARCPKCNEPIGANGLVLLHLTSSLKNGHHFNLIETLKAFANKKED